jgi:hypothetical protein
MATEGDLVLTAGIDARPIKAQLAQLQREIGTGIASAFSQAMATGTRSVAQQGLAAVGGGRTGTGAQAGLAAIGGNTANSSQVFNRQTAALVRLQNVQARANRQLGDTGQLTQRAERLTVAYNRALERYGVTAERTLQLDRARRLELDKTSAEIARQGGLLKVLKDEGEATRRVLGIGLQPGGREILTSGGINLAQQAIAAGGSLDAIAVGAATQLPELLQAISISSGAAAGAVTGLAAAVALAGPALSLWARHQREAANAAAILEGAQTQLDQATRRYGDSIADLPQVERASLISTTTAAIEQQRKQLDAARDDLVAGMRDLANTTTTMNTAGGLIEVDDGSLDKLVELKRQTDLFAKALRETNSVSEAFKRSGLDEKDFAADAAAVRDASDKLDQLNTQLDQLQGKKLPDLAVKGLTELRQGVELLERLARIPDADRRELFRVRAEAVREARELKLPPDRQIELVAMREREAAAQRKIAAADEAEQKRKANAETLAGLEREAKISRELAGIGDANARARREAALRAFAEADAAGMTVEQTRRSVDLALAVYDAKARAARADEASAAAIKEQEARLEKVADGIRAVGELKARMNEARSGAEQDLAERQALLDAQRQALLAGPDAADAALRRERDRQSLANRLDLKSNPALQQDYDRLLPDTDKLSEQEFALDRLLGTLEQLQSPTDVIIRDMGIFSDALDAGAIDLDVFGRGMDVLSAKLGKTRAEMERLRLETKAASGDLGAGFTLAFEDMVTAGLDTRRMWGEVFSTIGGTVEGVFRDAMDGSADLRESARRMLQDLAVVAARMAAIRLMAAALDAYGGGKTGSTAPASGGGGGWLSLVGSAVGTAVGAYFGQAGAGAQAGAAVGSATGGGGGGYDPSTGMRGGSARGNVFLDGQIVRAFARGGIIDRPTAIPLRDGMGIAGENRRPEAILPLARDTQGRLGVRAKGAGGSPSITTNNSISVQVHANGDMDDAQAQRMGKLISEQIDRKVNENLIKQSRPGGVLHRRYG